MVARTTTQAGLPNFSKTIAVGIVIVLAVTVVVVNSHAVEKHGTDALEVRKCTSNNPTINYRSKLETDRFILLCLLPDGRWGAQIIAKVNGVWKEVTAYVPKDGSWKEVSDFILKNAARYRGPLP